jgi:hypothetical protein
LALLRRGTLVPVDFAMVGKLAQRFSQTAPWLYSFNHSMRFADGHSDDSLPSSVACIAFCVLTRLAWSFAVVIGNCSAMNFDSRQARSNVFQAAPWLHPFETHYPMLHSQCS